MSNLALIVTGEIFEELLRTSLLVGKLRNEEICLGMKDEVSVNVFHWSPRTLTVVLLSAVPSCRHSPHRL
jgi:hypothetical protein